MRPARLSPSRPNLGVVLVAHGSRDPRAAVATEALARAVGRAHPAWAVRASYLDHAGPRPVEVLAALPVSRAVLVPLLLTSAYHGRVDIPAVLAAAESLPLTVSPAEVLGPSPRARTAAGHMAAFEAGAGQVAAFDAGAGHVAAFEAGVGQVAAFDAGAGHVAAFDAGFQAGGSAVVSPLLVEGLVRGLPVADLDAVVLAAAGTRDAAARSTVEDVANALSARLRVPCIAAYASATPPAAGEVVEALRAAGARRVGMAAYFLAPGLLYDNAARSARAAGAVAVAQPLRDAPELVRLVAARVAAAVREPLAPAA